MHILGGSHGSVIVRQMVIYGQHIYCLLVNHLGRRPTASTNLL